MSLAPLCDKVTFPVDVKLEWSTNKDGVPICTLRDEQNAVHPDNVLEFVVAHKAATMPKYKENNCVLLRGFPLDNWALAEQVFMRLTDHKVCVIGARSRGFPAGSSPCSMTLPCGSSSGSAPRTSLCDDGSGSHPRTCPCDDCAVGHPRACL